MRTKLSIVLAMGFAFALPAPQAWATVEGISADIRASYIADQKTAADEEAATLDELTAPYCGYGVASGGYPGQTYGANPNTPCPPRGGSPTYVASLESNSSVQPASFDAFKATPGQTQYFVRTTSQSVMACAIKAIDGSDMKAIKQDAVYQPEADAMKATEVSFYGQLQSEREAKENLLLPINLPPVLGQLPQMFQMLTGGQQGIMMNFCNIIPNKGACQAAMKGPMAAGSAAFGNLAMTAASRNLNGGPGAVRHPSRPARDRTRPPTSGPDPTQPPRCGGPTWRQGCPNMVDY